MAIESVSQDQAASTVDLGDPALVKIRDLVYRISGIFQTDNKFYLLASRCQRRMKVLNAVTFSAYLDHLTIKSNRDAELRSLLNEITIGETYFFRSQQQIDAVSKIILPKLVSLPAKQGVKKIRIWSAGCSTGEEPYTMSILLMEQLLQKHSGWSFEIIATDLNDNSVVKCKEGIYAEYAVRNLNAQMRSKYFTPEGNLHRVREEVRAHVKFERVNLQDQSKILFMKGFDIIFCCNVLIYFDGASKKRIVEHFFSGLLPGGYFFLGNSESLYGINDQFRLLHFPSAIAYWKPAPGEEPGGVK